ncbi:hypothetical protein A1342_03540 [Methylomonas methanica]|uniref:Uncharacterized protein n=1 Tax=Methylomonas denitrificans TaxID=1538553 RepID=A0A126T1K7_9GAMM|nr:hypothetical protein JT25_005580 [Methylomonas denitrificans]OAI02021.1 hypothetical protein A1342_03540 [Methylomonas methanica]
MQALLFAYILNGSLFAFSCLSKLIFIGSLGSVLPVRHFQKPTLTTGAIVSESMAKFVLEYAFQAYPKCKICRE